MKKALCMMLTICIFITMCACQSDAADEYYVSFSVGDAPVTIDPQLAQSQSELLVVSNAFEGLMRLDGDGNVVCGAAESYTVSSDKRSYVFKLRNGLVWSDGKKLTASDFAYGLTRALLPETKAPMAECFYCISRGELVHRGSADPSTLGITVRDESTLELNLEYSDTDLLHTLASAAAMPCRKDFFNSTDGKYGLSSDDIITNGPFYIRRWSQSTSTLSLRLARSNDYVGTVKVLPAAVLLYFNVDSADLVTNIDEDQLDSGCLDRIYYKSATDTGLTIEASEYLSWCLYLNPSGILTSSETIRNCLSRSIDRDMISGYLSNGFTVSNRILPSNLLVGEHSYASYTSANSITAAAADKNILNESFKTEIELLDAEDKLTLLYVDDTMIEQTARTVAQCWQSCFGVKVVLNKVSLSELYTRLTPTGFDAAIIPIGDISMQARSAISAFSSDSSANHYSFENTEYDAIISAMRDKDEGVVAAYLLEAEKYLYNKSLVIPLVSESRFITYDDDISGIKFISAHGIVSFSSTVKAAN